MLEVVRLWLPEGSEMEAARLPPGVAAREAPCLGSGAQDPGTWGIADR